MNNLKMEQKEIYKGKTGDLEVVVRYPQYSDLEEMCTYMNIISKEKTYITWQGEKISIDYEKKYLKGVMERIKNKQAVKLLLFINNKLAGISDVSLYNRVQSHVGDLGISISKDYRGKGFGKLLLKQILNESKKLLALKIITLAVFATNDRAIVMYKKFGFVEFGRLPNGNQYKGKFVDDVFMYKKI